MRKLSFFGLMLTAGLMMTACSSDTVKGDPEYLAGDLLTAVVDGKTMFFLKEGNGNVSVTYNQTNPLHKNSNNQYVLTDYVGEIEVPSTITVNGVTYTVTG
ncbi:MAG: hypothetical protein II812_02355, partial [Prevotella sp.]|nr:hypothetical protein [Prevotella sp.]